MKIFIAVEYSYDYYEFQENISVYDNIESCKNAILKLDDYENEPIVTIEANHLHFQKEGRIHYYIQEWEVKF